MRTSRFNPTLNAGSMADIAFLLLIFFLVSTTIANDKGIARKLPAKCPTGEICDTKAHERNVLRIQINTKGQLNVEDSPTSFAELGTLLVLFIDNNGDGSCSYCKGKKLATSSDNPKEAIISLSANRLTPYRNFIKTQGEISKAYYLLRRDYAQRIFNKDIQNLTKGEEKEMRLAYPLIISEADIK